MNGERGRGDGTDGLGVLGESAANGDAHSQAQLGLMYLTGRGVVRDYKLALSWLQKSAAQENAPAQAHLGQMYEKGLGVDADVQSALAWYERSAAQGNALGQIRLGDLYLGGLGVDQSTRKALACYLEAAEQAGDPENSAMALLRMGAMYCQGRGVEKDLRKGFGIYQRAARLGNAEAQLRVGTMYRDGVGVQRNYKKAREWLQKSIKKNWAPADSAMGDLYRDGLVIERDIPEAMKWYKRAAAGGDPYAKTELAKLQQEDRALQKPVVASTPAGPGGSGTQARAAYPERPGTVAGTAENGAGKSPGKSAEKRIVPPYDGPQPAPQALDASFPGRESPSLTMAPTASPRRERRVRTLPVPATRLYLLGAIGLVLALIVVLRGFAGREDELARDAGPDTVEIAALPWPAARSLPPALPQVPPEAFRPSERGKVPPKPSKAVAPPVVAAAPAAPPSAAAAPPLRREFRTLDEGQVAAMLTARRLFDARRNPGGSYPHGFEPLSVAGLRLVVDRAAGLVWTGQQNPVKMNLSKTESWIQSLNRAGYGGIRSWRLPTVEEAASLLQRSAGEGRPFLPEAFAADITEIWTGDRLTDSESWIIDSLNGTLRGAKNKSRLRSLMVSCEPGPPPPAPSEPARPAKGDRPDGNGRQQ